MKTCPICKETKSLDEFNKYFSKSRNKYRPQNYCKACEKSEKTRRSAEYYEKHTEKRKQYAKEYRVKNRETVKAKKQRFKVLYRQELKDCYIASQLGQRWGVSTKAIRAVPGLLDSYRAMIQLKRTIKNINNEKQNRRSA